MFHHASSCLVMFSDSFECNLPFLPLIWQVFNSKMVIIYFLVTIFIVLGLGNLFLHLFSHV